MRLVLVGGLPGTGKSTLAAGLADAMRATVLRSEEIRKELARLGREEPAPAVFGEGIYRPESTAEGHAELLRRASVATGVGENVILDGS